MNISRHTNSFPKGSTARRRVIRVVSSRCLPHGIVDEKANGPVTIGQNVLSREFGCGSGLGGRIFSHRYELFDHALRVSTDDVVNRVAGDRIRKVDRKPNSLFTQACTQICGSHNILGTIPNDGEIEIFAKLLVLEDLSINCVDIELLIQALGFIEAVLEGNRGRISLCEGKEKENQRE